MSAFRQQYVHNFGFTLIEMLVALSVFTIVITMTVGAVVSLLGANKAAQSQQSTITTLTFVLDSMTREIRTGINYYCDSSANLDTETPPPASSTGSVRNCPTHANFDRGVSFVEAGTSLTSGAGSNRIVYYFDSSSSTRKTIMRRVGTGTAQSIIADGITLINAQFFVTGAARLGTGTDINQPTVTIILEALDDNGATTTLQTTVTQRELDI